MSSPNASQPLVNERAKSNLSRVALFLGELRDGLTMVRFYKHKKGIIFPLVILLLKCNVHQYLTLQHFT
jgi:hypothetical protein